MTLSQRGFTLGSIDVFTTYQGSVVYAALIGLSLLTINRQQLNPAQLKSQSLEPVSVDLRGLDQTSALPSEMTNSKPCGRWRWLAAGTAGSAHVAVDPAARVAIVQWWR